MTNQIYSPAMLKTYEQCRKKFFLHYIRNIFMPQSATQFETGKNIHALAGYYLSRLDITKFEKSLTPLEVDLWQNLKKNEYFNKTPFKTEFQLNFQIENLWFGGRIDAIVKDGNNYFILDYKTGSAPKNPKYDYQTMIYLLAVDKFLENYDSLHFIYISLKNKENIVIDCTKDLLQEYETKLINICTKIEALTENNLPVYKNCVCEYAKICF